MQQGQSIDTKNHMFALQNSTNLTLISDNGSVTSTRTADGGLNVNAADKWKTIGATAKHNINLSGDGSIILGNSGTNPNLSLRTPPRLRQRFTEGHAHLSLRGGSGA